MRVNVYILIMSCLNGSRKSFDSSAMSAFGLFVVTSSNLARIVFPLFFFSFFIIVFFLLMNQMCTRDVSKNDE